LRSDPAGSPNLIYPGAEYPIGAALEIEWFGHACFRITGSGGISIVTDPFDGRDLGYKTPDVAADIVLVSHEHFDHNKVNVVKGGPAVIRSAGLHRVKGVDVKGIQSYHDDAKGSKRGKNVIYSFELDGIAVAHLGDLGHVLSEAEAREIGRVDVVMIPVGGYFTIGPREADRVLGLIRPRVAIPMHYKTPAIDFPISPVEDFLKGKANVRRVGSNVLRLGREDLPGETQIVVLDYPR
jgi:L-ascorbate metabolism protein UlaG (beta-lactamase superfamily)